MMKDWKSHQDALMGKMKEYAKLQPEMMRAIVAVDNVASKPGHLDAKTHELIALAVAITTKCDGCLATHTQRAISHGASKEEIAEALSVAISLNAGAALAYTGRALEAFDALEK